MCMPVTADMQGSHVRRKADTNESILSTNFTALIFAIFPDYDDCWFLLLLILSLHAAGVIPYRSLNPDVKLDSSS